VTGLAWAQPANGRRNALCGRLGRSLNHPKCGIRESPPEPLAGLLLLRGKQGVRNTAGSGLGGTAARCERIAWRLVSRMLLINGDAASASLDSVAPDPRFCAMSYSRSRKRMSPHESMLADLSSKAVGVSEASLGLSALRAVSVVAARRTPKGRPVMLAGRRDRVLPVCDPSGDPDHHGERPDDAKGTAP
jgi:hypothetical protein